MDFAQKRKMAGLIAQDVADANHQPGENADAQRAAQRTKHPARNGHGRKRQQRQPPHDPAPQKVLGVRRLEGVEAAQQQDGRRTGERLPTHAGQIQHEHDDREHNGQAHVGGCFVNHRIRLQRDARIAAITRQQALVRPEKIKFRFRLVSHGSGRGSMACPTPGVPPTPAGPPRAKWCSTYGLASSKPYKCCCCSKDNSFCRSFSELAKSSAAACWRLAPAASPAAASSAARAA